MLLVSINKSYQDCIKMMEEKLVSFLSGFCGKKGNNTDVFQKQVECIRETVEKYKGDNISSEDVCAVILNRIQQCKDDCLSFPSEYGKDLMEYQSNAVQHLLANPGLITAFATGTGKTLTAVSSAACIHHICQFLSKPLRIIVVTPASLVTNMESEFKKFPYFMRNKGAYEVIGSEMFRRYVLASKHEKHMQLQLHNYLEEGFGPNRTEENFKKIYYGVFPERGKLMDQTIYSKNAKNIVLDSNTFLIVDEAHEFKTDWDFTFHDNSFGGPDPDSVTRARVFMEDVVPYVWKILLMTATPTLNRWYDILNLISAVKDIPRQAYKAAIFETQTSKLADYLLPLVPRITPEQEDIIGQEPSGKSSKSVGSFMMKYPLIMEPDKFENAIAFRNVDYESGDFPSRTDTYVKAYMSNQFYREYEAVIAKYGKKKGKSSGDDLEDEAQRAFTLQRHIANIPGNPKNQVLLELIRSNQYKKISIYSRFVGPLKGIYEQIQKDANELGYILSMITGELTKTQKDAVLKKFNESDKFIILLSDAGGQGLDFKGINVSIVYEPGINESREEQFIGRAVRYRSHIHLPPEERKVLVMKYVMMFPLHADRNKHTPDQSLISNSLAKSMQSKFLLNQLQALSK